MNPIYNFGIRLYRCAAKLVASKNVKAKKMLEGQAQAIDYIRSHVNPDDRYIWIHVASLGEFEQGRPLIEKIKAENPQAKILLTFFSPSGYEVRKNYPMADAICYLPFDLPDNVTEFLDAVNPSMAIFVKYEFWGNYLQELHRRNIPIYIISAIFRDSQPFFKWWGGMFRQIPHFYEQIFVQDEASKERLLRIGVNNVVVAGDTRFDRVTDIMRGTHDEPAIEAFVKDSPLTLIVGSSWEADEDVYIPWINEHKDVKVIIAPHEFDDERLRALASRIEGGVQMLSDYEVNPQPSTRCVIVNCFGKLSSLYRYADIAYIGGGFGTGIHNVNEAAVYGMPVLFGPTHSKFKEALDLIACGGGYSFANEAEFRKAIDAIANDSDLRARSGAAAGEYIKNNLGATEKIYKAIF